MLGICYGLHFITHKLGGKVVPGPKREYGHAEITVSEPFAAYSKTFRRRSMSGCPTVMKPSPAAGFKVIAHDPAMLWPPCRMKLGAYGRCSFILKFITRKRGIDLLRNFVYDICGAAAIGLRNTSSMRPSARSKPR